MTHDEQPLDRKTAVLNAKRVIVKIGSAVLRGPDGLDPERIAHLAMQIATLKGQGKEVIVVSSGAILAGTGRLGLAQNQASPRSRRQHLLVSPFWCVRGMTA